jgi:hypothetical protein
LGKAFETSTFKTSLGWGIQGDAEFWSHASSDAFDGFINGGPGEEGGDQTAEDPSAA